MVAIPAALATTTPVVEPTEAIEELESGKGQRFKSMKDVWDSIDHA